LKSIGEDCEFCFKVSQSETVSSELFTCLFGPKSCIDIRHAVLLQGTFGGFVGFKPIYLINLRAVSMLTLNPCTKRWKFLEFSWMMTLGGLGHDIHTIPISCSILVDPSTVFTYSRCRVCRWVLAAILVIPSSSKITSFKAFSDKKY
jgi:hypothetical protein